jgi:hypothetical protein
MKSLLNSALSCISKLTAKYSDRAKDLNAEFGFDYAVSLAHNPGSR